MNRFTIVIDTDNPAAEAKVRYWAAQIAKNAPRRHRRPGVEGHRQRAPTPPTHRPTLTPRQTRHSLPPRTTDRRIRLPVPADRHQRWPHTIETPRPTKEEEGRVTKRRPPGALGAGSSRTPDASPPVG
jgi:hypothetical protein